MATETRPEADGGATAQSRFLVRLSRRQQQTLHYLSMAYAEKEIAVVLGLSQHTVHEYVKALYRRFGVNTRAQLLVTVMGGSTSIDAV